MLPKDPVMLLSFVNTGLRDEYDDLADFCAAEDVSQGELCAKLKEINREYSPERNQFI